MEAKHFYQALTDELSVGGVGIRIYDSGSASSARQDAPVVAEDPLLQTDDGATWTPFYQLYTDRTPTVVGSVGHTPTPTESVEQIFSSFFGLNQRRLPKRSQWQLKKKTKSTSEFGERSQNFFLTYS